MESFEIHDLELKDANQVAKEQQGMAKAAQDAEAAKVMPKIQADMAKTQMKTQTDLAKTSETNKIGLMKEHIKSKTALITALIGQNKQNKETVDK